MSWVLGVAPVRHNLDLRDAGTERDPVQPRPKEWECFTERIGLDFPVGVCDEAFAVECDGACWRIHLMYRLFTVNESMPVPVTVMIGSASRSPGLVIVPDSDIVTGFNPSDK